MASLGDLIRIIDVQDYLLQDVLNIYFYRITSITGIGGTYLADFADWFEDHIVTPVAELQCDGLTHRAIQLDNLTNELDTHTKTISVSGAISSDDSTRAPSYVSVGFKLNRESLATRNGYKRFGGLSEGSIAGNNFGADPGDIAAVETALAEDIVLGIVTVAEPVIVQRPIPSPATSYVYSSIGSATFRNLGSQNTRKPGHGG